MHFSLADAAKRVGLSRSSIYRLIDEGKLSSILNRQGKKVVELTELIRVFGNIDGTDQEDKQHNPVRIQNNERKDNLGNMSPMLLEIEKLRFQLQTKEAELQFKEREINFTKERLEEVKQIAEKMQHEKDTLFQLIKSQSLLLEHKPTAKKSPAPAPITKANKPSEKVSSVEKKIPATATTTVNKKPSLVGNSGVRPVKPTKPHLPVKPTKPVRSSRSSN